MHASSPFSSSSLSNGRRSGNGGGGGGANRSRADALAGAIASLISLWVFYPVDVWKTRVQAGLGADADVAANDEKIKEGNNANNEKAGITARAASMGKRRLLLLLLLLRRSRLSKGRNSDAFEDEDDLDGRVRRGITDSDSLLSLLLRVTNEMYSGWRIKTMHTAASSYCFFYVHSYIASRWNDYAAVSAVASDRRRAWSSSSSSSSPPPTMSTTTRLMLSAAAAMINTLLTLPLDVLSTRCQTGTTRNLRRRHDDDGNDDDDKNETTTRRGREGSAMIRQETASITEHDNEDDQDEQELTAVGSRGEHDEEDDDENDDDGDDGESRRHHLCTPATSDNPSNGDDRAASSRKRTSRPPKWNRRFRTSSSFLDSCTAILLSTPASSLLHGQKSDGDDAAAVVLRSFFSADIDALGTLRRIASLWRGLRPALVLCVNPAINYTAFDTLKSHYMRYKTDNGGNGKTDQKKGLSMFEAFVLGLLAKFVATMVTYPMIRAKVMIMSSSSSSDSHAKGERRNGVEHDDDDDVAAAKKRGAAITTTTTTTKGGGGNGMLECMAREYRERGVRDGLYKGCRIQLFHTVLKSALLMTMKEKINQTTRKWYE